jgi:hypothetical protein
MFTSKVVKDAMIDVSEYPHVPYWFIIKKAIIRVINKICYRD